jgi:hypothetical protein
MAAPGLQQPAKKALATLDREWGWAGSAPPVTDDQPGQLRRGPRYADVGVISLAGMAIGLGSSG